MQLLPSQHAGHHVKLQTVWNNSLLLCAAQFFCGEKYEFIVIFWPKITFFQIWTYTNLTSATFCSFYLHTLLGVMLSHKIFTKIPCFYVLLNFLGGKYWFLVIFWPKIPFFSNSTLHKFHICNFLQLLSTGHTRGHVKL